LELIFIFHYFSL